MKYLLFTTGLFQILLGVTGFAVLGAKFAQSGFDGHETARYRIGLLVYFVPWLSAVMTLGGILCAVTRLAYPATRRPNPAPETEPVAAAERPRATRPLMERVLRVLSLAQLGTGVVVIVGLNLPLVQRRSMQGAVDGYYQVLWASAAALLLAGLGGILWVLTRIAYRSDRSGERRP